MKLLLGIKKFYKYSTYKLKELITISESILFTALLNILMLVISIITLIVAINTLDRSNEQFQENSRQSDIQFRKQLEYSKILNDSIILQISQLQRITNNQLLVSDRQLKMWEKELTRSANLEMEAIFNDQLPEILCGGFYIKNSGNIEAKIDRIFFTIPTTNLINCTIDNAVQLFPHEPDWFDHYILDFSKNELLIKARRTIDIKAFIAYKKDSLSYPTIQYSIWYSSQYDTNTVKEGILRLQRFFK